MILSPIKERLFKVAILGRPNVGKSTLFNRLLGKRRAITDPTPGVTRDTLESECAIEDVRFLLIDTGGYNLETGSLERIIADRSMRSAEDTDLILLIVDVNELNGEDYDFIERLRKFEEKLILVVNKVDNRELEYAVENFHELGFRKLLGVSAAHGRNVDELKTLISAAARKTTRQVVSSDPLGRDEEIEKEYIHFSILGKPNTGKSTLLNYLLKEERSLVTDSPGTTRDPIEGRFYYKKIPFLVVDTAGIRRKQRIKDAVEYYSVNRAIRSISESDLVYLLIDAVEGLSEQDKKIASLAVKKGKGIILVLSKWDLLKEVPNRFQAIEDRIRFLFPVLDFAPIFPISALSGEGVRKLLEATLTVRGQLDRRVETARLNKALKSWLESYPLPVRGRNVRIRYATQVEVNPVKFIFFVNNLKGFPMQYSNYLKNKIRRELGFSLVPIDLEFRETRSISGPSGRRISPKPGV